MPTSLITGGAGFIGINLVNKLLSLKHKVIVLDNLNSGKKDHLPLNNPRLTFIQIDLRKDLHPIFSKYSIHYVFHLAAQINVQKSLLNPLDDAENNILSSINLLQTIIHFKIKKIIYSSTGGAIYKNSNQKKFNEKSKTEPISFYGTSKYAVEDYLRIYGTLHSLPYTILRYANIYGPYQKTDGEGGLITILISKLLKKQKPILFNCGKGERDYVYVDDVVNANLLAMEFGQNKAYNIGTGIATKTLDIFNLISQKLNCKIKPILKPARLGEIQSNSLNSDLAHLELNWQNNYSLGEGIDQTIAWYKKNAQ